MITIKIGGSVVDNLHPTTISDIKRVAEKEGVILVHGGGKEVTKVSEQLGKEPKFVTSPSGIKSRYTDKETAEILLADNSILILVSPNHEKSIYPDELAYSDLGDSYNDMIFATKKEILISLFFMTEKTKQ